MSCDSRRRLNPNTREGQVRHRARCHDDEARVVRDQMQAPKLLLRAPADPAVARGQLERAGLPADEREPARAHGRDMAQSLAEYAMKRQIVMGRHQPVPAPVFLRAPGRTHRDRAQINATSRCRQRSHARYTATSKTKWPVPASAAAVSPVPLHEQKKSPCPATHAGLAIAPRRSRSALRVGPAWASTDGRNRESGIREEQVITGAPVQAGIHRMKAM